MSGEERSSSQFDEDRVVAALLDDAGITGTVGEFGAGDGEHLSNSALFRRRGWPTVLAESNEEHAERLRSLRGGALSPGPLVYNEPVTTGNVAARFGRCDAFVSIDVDGDDYLLLDALLSSGARPAVLCVEFNQSIPWWWDVYPLVDSDPANIVGSSAGALCRLLAYFGYRLRAVTDCNLIASHDDRVPRAPSALPLDKQYRVWLGGTLGARQPVAGLTWLVTAYDGTPYWLGRRPPWGLSTPMRSLADLGRDGGYRVEEMP